MIKINPTPSIIKLVSDTSSDLTWKTWLNNLYLNVVELISLSDFNKAFGNKEYVTLTITTASTSNEGVKVELNGMIYNVTTTNSNDANVTASEISSFDYRSLGNGWITESVLNVVHFKSMNNVGSTGAFSFFSTTANANFKEIIHGNFGENV